LHRAQDAAGSQDVLVTGGANVARQRLSAGLLDEIRLHVVPVVLGAGTLLFDRVRSDVDVVCGVSGPAGARRWNGVSERRRPGG